jgi:O-antigen/teichoic acid export membrane protein
MVTGGIWVFTLRITSRALQVVSLIFLARILDPRSFGLLGVTVLALAVLETLTESGFDAALIQKHGDIDAYIDTAWFVQLLRGLTITLILAAAAPLVAAFFRQPEATPLLRVVALSALLRGMGSIRVVYFRKELEFRKEFIYSLSGTIAQFVVAIGTALILHNAWALVLGYVAGDFARMIASYVMQPYWPKSPFDPRKATELFRFGRWVMARNIVGYLVEKGDDVVVGRLLGAASLGLYQVAYRMSEAGLSEVGVVVSRVAFPAYSKLQHDLPRLRALYLNTLQISLVLSGFVAGGVFALATEFTRLFLGDQWMPMVPALRLLAAAGMVKALLPAMGPLLKSLGRPDIAVKIACARLAVLATLIYPLSLSAGIVGASVAVLLSVVAVAPLHYAAATRALALPPADLAAVIFPPATSSIIMAISGLAIEAFLIPEPWTTGVFLLVAAACALVYSSLMFGFVLLPGHCFPLLTEARKQLGLVLTPPP